MSDWTIESELCKLVDAQDWNEALRQLGLIQADETAQGIRVRTNWERGGAETYIFTFEVVTSAGKIIPLILKAYTPTPGIVGVESGLKVINDRRSLLFRNGIAVPHLYFTGKGVTLEEYIPWRLHDRLPELLKDTASRNRIINRLIQFAMVLDKLGFKPINPFHDLRTDDREVFAIDFGEDLGEANREAPGAISMGLLRDWLKQFNFDLNDKR